MARAQAVRRIYQRAAARYDSSGIAQVVDRLRGRVLREASGDVLDLGVGAGATFGFYSHAVRRVTGVDVSRAMLDRAYAAATGLAFGVDLLEVDFQMLTFRDRSFDTVVSSLALCGVPDPGALFGEIARVLRPGGRLLAVEHVRPRFPGLGVVADLSVPVTERLVGCSFNRRTPELARAAGFAVRELDRKMLGVFVAFVATPPG
ncbi:MAG TPA: methyltransferase domain-containing protein [Dongiaceae bacterium]|nr:methyltransferase domain-containing protein [Dongiaceae bacterium]